MRVKLLKSCVVKPTGEGKKARSMKADSVVDVNKQDAALLIANGTAQVAEAKKG